MTASWYSAVYKTVERETGLQHAEWRLLRDEILIRDNFTCLRCDKKFRSKKYLSVHHLIPRANGGSNAPANLVTLCNPCHDYVEVNDLRTTSAIIGSMETEDESEPGPEPDPEPDPYNRPEWHRWVYGGARKPSFAHQQPRRSHQEPF